MGKNRLLSGTTAPGRRARLEIPHLALRFVILWFGSSTWWIGSGTIAAAQAPEPPEPTPDGITLLDRIQVHPNYGSTVNVNRTKTDWSQNFQWRKEYQKLVAENSWVMNITKEEKRNNFRSRHGTGKLRLEYGMDRLGGWSGGADVTVQHNADRSFTIDKTLSNRNDSNLFITSGILSKLSRMALGLPEDEMEWTVTGSSGLSDDDDARHTESEGKLTRSEETRASGNDFAMDSQLRFHKGTTWRADANARIGGTKQDSRTEVRETRLADSVRVVADVNRNRSRRFNLNAGWLRTEKNQATLTAVFNREQQEFYSAAVHDRDRSNGLEQKLGLNVKAAPLWGIELGMNAENALTQQAYKISTLGRGRRRTTLDGNVHCVTGPALWLLRDIESTTEIHWENAANTFQGPSDFDARDRRIRENLRRPLNDRVAVVATAEGQLTESFYRDRSQDKDDLRLLLDGVLGYKPMEGLDTRLTAQWQKRQTINIPGKLSANSNTQKSYRIGAELNFQLNEVTKLSQKYNMTADYSFYDFNENNNGLIRTTEVRTAFTSTVGTKARLDAEHSFRFKDSGQYVRTTEGGPRLYGKATKETYQFLTVTTRYDFTTGFDLHAMQRFEIRETTQILTKKVTRTEKLQFTGGVNLDYKFEEGFAVNVRADKIQSTSERSYWQITASVNRGF